jgi:hypothetical protein
VALLGRHGWGYGDFVPKQHLRTNRWEIVDAYRVPNAQQIKELATLILLGPRVACRIIIIIECVIAHELCDGFDRVEFRQFRRQGNVWWHEARFDICQRAIEQY